MTIFGVSRVIINLKVRVARVMIAIAFYKRVDE